METLSIAGLWPFKETLLDSFDCYYFSVKWRRVKSVVTKRRDDRCLNHAEGASSTGSQKIGVATNEQIRGEKGHSVRLRRQQIVNIFWITMKLIWNLVTSTRVNVYVASITASYRRTRSRLRKSRSEERDHVTMRFKRDPKDDMGHGVLVFCPPDYRVFNIFAAMPDDERWRKHLTKLRSKKMSDDIYTWSKGDERLS